MRPIKPTIAAAVASILLLAGAASSVEAAGFSRTISRTTLGQPLDFVALLVMGSDESFDRTCVAATVVAGDRLVPAAQVRSTLEGLGSAQPRVRVTTAVPMDEPVVTIEVTVGCNSKMSRRFVTFVDPPGMATALVEPMPETERSADARSAELGDFARRVGGAGREGSASPSPASSAEPSTRRLASTAPRASAASQPGNRRTTAASPRTAGERTARAAGTRRPATRTANLGRGNGAARGGPRLQLDAPSLLASRALPAASAPVAAAPVAAATPAPTATTPSTTSPPALAAASATATALAAATPPAASATDAEQTARMQALEASLAQLRAEQQSQQQAQQQAIATLQARLKQAESDRPSHTLLYALAGFALLMTAVAIALWRLRPRQRRQAAWFDGQASRLQREAAEGAQEEADAVALHDHMRAQRVLDPKALNPIEPPESWRTRSGTLLRATTAPSAIGGLEVTTVLAPSAARDVVMASAEGGAELREGPAEASMEELIDLEQQAEFFVVLGQDEAAIALLDQYVRATGGRSPLPYLQLLDLHQRRGDEASYERVREAFDAQFHAQAPAWRSGGLAGRVLEDYPQTVARLQSLWPTPLSAMEALDAMLFRRGSVEAYDFPAYRELLFLYSLARELAGQVETDFGAIDLFLPLEGAEPLRPASNLVEFDIGEIDIEPSREVDLDVSQWDRNGVDEANADHDANRDADLDDHRDAEGGTPSRPLRLVR